MRTTITLDADVAAKLLADQKRRKVTFRRAVNDALRKGLSPRHGKRRAEPFSTKPAELGRCLVGSLDDIHGVLDLVEGDGHR